MMGFDLIAQVIGTIAFGGAIYGGIRADLKTMHERIERNANDIGRARQLRRQVGGPVLQEGKVVIPGT